MRALRIIRKGIGSKAKSVLCQGSNLGSLRLVCCVRFPSTPPENGGVVSEKEKSRVGRMNRDAEWLLAERGITEQSSEARKRDVRWGYDTDF